MFWTERHQTIDKPMLAKDERIYAIGDVHGRQDLLIQLLHHIAADGEACVDDRRVRLIFLGDYIDRGDDSKKVLETLCILGSEMSAEIVFLLGNHEVALLDFMKDPTHEVGWLDHGAEQTLASYGVHAQANPDAFERACIAQSLAETMGHHLTFLENLLPMARSGDFMFSHAGINPKRDTQNQQIRDLVWGHREFLCEKPVPGFCFVHGHFDGAEPLSLPGRICVDTGAYYSGILTAVRLDAGTAFLSVNAQGANSFYVHKT